MKGFEEGNKSSVFEQSNSPKEETLVGSSEGDMDTAPEPEPEPEPPRKKPGRARKSSEEASASRKSTAANSHENRDFTPHIITVDDGEDIRDKIMLFIQQTRRQVCVMAASGSVSSATFGKPPPTKSNIIYEGQYDIISLTGSYVSKERRGRRIGRFSASLSTSDGQIIGGSIAGPLKAAGPVLVIAATFKKPRNVGIKGDVSTQPLAAVGEPESSLGFRPEVGSSSGNIIREIEEETSSLPLDRRSAGFELTGITGHGAHQSPKKEDFDQSSD